MRRIAQAKVHIVFALIVIIGVSVTCGLSGVDVTISGAILGWSGKHSVFVALWDADGFLERPVQQLQIQPHAEAVFRFTMPSGRWAVSAFEDLNDNGVLDMGIFGPKEPNGFWHPFHGRRKPRFNDVADFVEKDTPHADIKLQK